MYAIYGNIYHQYTPNVSIYTIHGSYGLDIVGILRECSWIRWFLSTMKPKNPRKSRPNPVLPSPGIMVFIWEIIPIHGRSIQVSELL